MSYCTAPFGRSGLFDHAACGPATEETRKHVKKFIAVHYYFEGHGSLTTMTKAETEKHIREVVAFVSQQEEKKKTDSLSVVM